MNVAYCFTSNWLRYAMVSIYSLLCHNDINTLYIFTDKPVILPFECNIKYFLYKDTLCDINFVNRNTMYSDASLIKLFLHRYIDTSRVLFIDCDTIVDSSIEHLYALDLKERCAAMCIESEDGAYEGYKKEEEVIEHYYNTGVILLNLDRVRYLNRDSKIKYYLNRYSYFLPDQDVFNVVYSDEIVSIEKKWNFHDFADKQVEPVIYHWAGCNKDEWIYKEQYCEVWIKYEKECPYV